jgi:hypothetical protein
MPYYSYPAWDSLTPHSSQAQKAHRERRAAYIKHLEGRVINLESRLASADAISMENDRLRGELDSVGKVLAPLTDGVLHSTFGPATPASLISASDVPRFSYHFLDWVWTRILV